jgi:amino acid adenylation domain-containing protein
MNLQECELPKPLDYSGLMLHELFENQVARNPQAVALMFDGDSMTYQELNQRTDHLANYLRNMGLGPDSLVGLCLDRGFEMIVGILGILKAGGAYVPMDPFYPAERLRYMLEDVSVQVLLTHKQLDTRIPQCSVKIIRLDEDWELIQRQVPDKSPLLVSPDNLAYVIYTSGSTGKPKGVAVTHHNVVRLLGVTEQWFHFGPSDVWTLFHSYAFDFSVWEIWGALAYGGRLVVVPALIAKSTEQFLNLLAREGVTVLNQTPSAFGNLSRKICEDQHKKDGLKLRIVIFGGEMLQPWRLREWEKQWSSNGPQLINMYGITETTVHVTYHCVTSPEIQAGDISVIGCPIPDLQAYVLDRSGNLLPRGVVGELYIGGAGLARGYVNHADWTAMRFVPNPYSVKGGERLYRTGDKARWEKEGKLEYVGRMDEQVKVRGYRIELGEIEAVLSGHQWAREVAVVVREEESGDKRLVAYVVGEKEREMEGKELRRYMEERLPEYMVPVAFVRLAAMPLTTNGKLNRKALPEPDQDAYAIQEYEAPMGKIEEALAEIWADLLGVQRVGRADNFFELGGHSLLAMRMIEHLRQRGLDADLRTLFGRPTLADLAETMRGAGPEMEIPANGIPSHCEVIRPEMLTLVDLTQEEIDAIVRQVPGGAANIQDIYGLAPLQEGMLFHHLFEAQADPYLLAGVMRCPNREGLEKYVEALQWIVDRHDILRTAILWEGLQEPVQVVWKKIRVAIEEVKLEGDGDAVQQLYERFHPRRYRMDVRQAPMLHVYMTQEKEQNGKWLLMMLLHHLIGDHSTMEVLEEEIEAYLLDRGKEMPAPEPFRNMVAQARLGVNREEHERFFRGLLEDIEEPTAPFDLLKVQGDGAGIEEATLRLDAGLTEKMRRQAKSLKVSTATLCHVAWACVVSRTSGREEAVFGTVLFGRMHGRPGAHRILGLSINTLPVRISLGEESVKEAVLKAQNLLADLIRHEHASLALAQRCSSVQVPAPLFTSLLNYRHIKMVEHKKENEQSTEGLEWLRSEERTNFPFVMSVDDYGKEVGLTAQTDALIDPMQICGFMRHALEWLVEALETEPARPLRAIEILPEADRHRLLYEWNPPCSAYPRNKCVHELFEEQAEMTPHTPAVIYQDRQLTYSELNQRANQLGHYLRGMGVGPETRVGLCLERSPEMIMAMLAILKTGGVYVPLDPEYPAERLQFMLWDASVDFVLTLESLKKRLQGYSGSVVLLDRSLAAIEEHSAGNPRLFGSPENLAYIIYTSGSTGQPKGIGIPHRAINRLICNTDYVSLVPGDRIAQASNSSFDAMTFEVWGALLLGGCVAGINKDTALSSVDLAKAIREQGINVMFCTTALFNQISREAPETFTPLRCLLFGGEAADPYCVRKVLGAKPPERLTHVYGPTETTTFATWHLVQHLPENAAAVSIGRSIRNTQVYVLNKEMNPVPVGVTGELYIGGDGLARGYINRPGLTAEKFVPNPFSKAGGTRLYRTGDLVRWQDEGRLDFLGRIDQQVKIRGFRVELGEIETAIQGHGAVREAVVLARQDEFGNKRLAAYVVSENGTDLTLDELRGYLRERLPEYMLPSACSILRQFPLTPNGKLDRKALSALGSARHNSSQPYVPPDTTTEKMIAQIWSEIFKIQSVGAMDDFFALGGHSLLAMTAISRLQEKLRYRIPIAALYEASTVRALAAHVDGHSKAAVWSPVVGLHLAGTKRPFFCVHNLAGSVFCYRDLANGLDNETPFYGFQARGLDGEHLPLNRIEDMASYYIAAMKVIQPEGPYLLGGHSLGSVIAFEMAQQLESAGEFVQLLVVMDGRAPQSPDEAQPEYGTEGHDGFAGRMQNAIRLIERFLKIDLPLEYNSFSQWSEERVFEHVLERLRAVDFFPADNPALLQGFLRLATANARAASQYRISNYRKVPIAVFEAASPSLEDYPGGVPAWGALAAGWSRYSSIPLRVFPVSGDHVSMLTQPHVQSLMEHLRVCLDAVEKPDWLSVRQQPAKAAAV